jgi:hypothetical protein
VPAIGRYSSLLPVTRTSIFGEEPENVHRPDAQEIQVGRGIHLAQGAVKIKGRDFGDEVEPLRKHHLKNIARSNVFLAALDAAQENFARVVPAWIFNFPGTASPPCATRRAQSRSQLSFQRRNIPQGAIVGLTRFFLRDIRRGHDVNLVAQVIEGQQAGQRTSTRIGQAKSSLA